MNYEQLTEKIGKRKLAKCSELYDKYVVEAMPKSRKHVIAGLEKYLARIDPLLGGGVNTTEILNYLKEKYWFYDQVVVLSLYFEWMDKAKKSKDKKNK